MCVCVCVCERERERERESEREIVNGLGEICFKVYFDIMTAENVCMFGMNHTYIHTYMQTVDRCDFEKRFPVTLN